MSDPSTDLYTLHTAVAQRHSSRSPPSPLRLLQDQIARGFVTLRFRDGLEADFCRYLRVSGRLSRASLIIVSLIGTITVLLVDQPVLGVPDALWLPTRALELGVMIPTTLACGLFYWYRPYSRHSELVMLALFVGVTAGMVGQRVVASHIGFDIPFELLGVSVVAMFALGRVRFWLMLPAAIIAAIAVMLTEVLFVDAGPNANYHIYTTGLLLTIGAMGGYSSEYFIRWTWLNATLLQYLSRLDGLTGLLNHKAVKQALENAIAHAHREGLDYAIAMIDIDAFGAYNNHYGHQAGDTALRSVAHKLGATARRPQDICGRFGGEEFVVLWMGGSARELTAIAEQTRAAIEDIRIAHAASTVAPCVTATVGLCHVSADEGRLRVEDVLRKADRLLYQGKAGGRNRVVSERFAARPEDLPAHPAADDSTAQHPRPKTAYT